MTCPTYFIDTLDEFDSNTSAVALYDNQTRIAFMFFDYIEVREFPSLNLISTWDMETIIPNWAGMPGNMAVTEEGYAFFHGYYNTTEFSVLFRMNLSTGSYNEWIDFDDFLGPSVLNAVLDGPAYNPYNGLLYDLVFLHESGNNQAMQLWSYDTEVPGVLNLDHTFETAVGVSQFGAWGDTPVFTADGGVWVVFDGAPQIDASGRLWRYDTNTDTAILFDQSYKSAGSDGVPIPYSDTSVIWKTSLGNFEFDPSVGEFGGPIGPVTCDIFNVGSGTARVTTDINGTTVVIFPTSTGVGRHIWITELIPPVIGSSFVKKLATSPTLFAGSTVEDGHIDGPALTTARFTDLTEIAALSGSPQRLPVFPDTNKYYVWDDRKVKIIHPCQELIQTIMVLL